MGIRSILVFDLLLSLFAITSLCIAEDEAIRSRLKVLEVPFIMNQGQMNEEVVLYAPTMGGTIFLNRDGGIVYSLPKSNGEGVALCEEVVDGRAVEMRGEGEGHTLVNCYFGGDSSLWRSRVPTYGQVNLGEVYAGITLRLKARANKVEKLFFMEPGTEPERIMIRVLGAEGMKRNSKGELEVSTLLGTVRFTRPVAFQEKDGEKIYVDAAYRVERNVYGFELGKYDRNAPLVIDPLLASTFLGGSGNDFGSDILMAPNGEVYICGDTPHASYPTTLGVYDESFNGNRDAFVSKLDGKLTSLIASTFLGGANNDYGSSLSLDDDGFVYLAGNTNSPDFPTTPNAFDTSLNGGADIFVARFDSGLSTLDACSFIGGSQKDAFAVMDMDSQGNIYVAGHTISKDYPTTAGAYNEVHNGGGLLYGEGGDLCVSKLDHELETLLASTFLGGANSDILRNMKIDSEDRLYVVGLTASADYPTTLGAFDSTYHGGGMFKGDGYVSKLDSDLSVLLASTYLGSSGDDWALAVLTVDGGDVFVSGSADAADFPTTPGAYQTSFHGGLYGDVFVSRLDKNLTTLISSTFLGGHGGEWAGAITMDDAKNILVSGPTLSTDFPTTPGAFDESFNGGDRDNFVSKLNPDLSILLASTFLGGNNREWCTVTLGPAGNLFLTGYTQSPDFPTTPGAYDETYNGHIGPSMGGDVFVAKLDGNLSGYLHCDAYTITESTGGVINFTLDATDLHANRPYYLLGSLSGTNPGFPLPGGYVTLPLNFDHLSLLVIQQINSPFFSKFMGVLDSSGKGTALLNTLGPVTGFAGTAMHFAFALQNPWDFVSNPVSVEIVK